VVEAVWVKSSAATTGLVPPGVVTTMFLTPTATGALVWPGSPITSLSGTTAD
jgi:hypothetical protein